MQNDAGRVTVTIQTRLLKYAEGVAPEMGQPFEVVEREHIVEGDEARRLLREMMRDVTSGRRAQRCR